MVIKSKVLVLTRFSCVYCPFQVLCRTDQWHQQYWLRFSSVFVSSLYDGMHCSQKHIYTKYWIFLNLKINFIPHSSVKSNVDFSASKLEVFLFFLLLKCRQQHRWELRFLFFHVLNVLLLSDQRFSFSCNSIFKNEIINWDNNTGDQERGKEDLRVKKNWF